MAYDVTVITTSGATLLAAATAANKLILAGCDATTDVLTDVQALAVSSRPVSPASNTTKVYLEGSYQEHVYCRILFVAGECTSADVNTLYLYGHTESDPTNDIVLAVMSSATSFHLPAVGEVSNTYGTLLDIVYSAETGAIETVNTSVFTTLAEFLRLKNRTVTTYKDGDPTSGDNQTILGTKTFSDWTNLHKINLCDVRFDTQIAGFGWLPDGAGSAPHYRLGLLDSTASDPKTESSWFNAIELYGTSPEDDLANNSIYIKSMNDTGGRGAYILVRHGDSEPNVILNTKYTESAVEYEQEISVNPTSIWISLKNNSISNQNAVLSINYTESGYDLPVIMPAIDNSWALGDDSYRFARAHIKAIYCDDAYINNSMTIDTIQTDTITCGTTLTIDASNLNRDAVLTAEYNKEYNNGVSYELELTQSHNSIDCAASDTAYVDYSSSSTGDATTSRIVQCDSNTGKIIQKASTTACTLTMTCSSTDNNLNRGYCQIANNGINLAVNGASNDVLSHLNMTTSTIVFELQDTTGGGAEVIFKYLEQQSSTYVYSVVPDPGTSSRIDLGTASKPFGKVYADDFIGKLNGYDNYINNIISEPNDSNLRYYKANDATGTSVDMSALIANCLINGGTYGGSLRLCMFRLEVGSVGPNPSDVIDYSPGTVFDSSDDTTGLRYYGKLYDAEVINTAGSYTVLYNNALSGKWATLNTIHFDSNTPQYASTLVLAIRVG